MLFDIDFECIFWFNKFFDLESGNTSAPSSSAICDVRIQIVFLLFSEAGVWRCFSKYMFLKISQYSQENTCWGLFLIKLLALKLQDFMPAIFLTKGSNTAVFL